MNATKEEIFALLESRTRFKMKRNICDSNWQLNYSDEWRDVRAMSVHSTMNEHHSVILYSLKRSATDIFAYISFGRFVEECKKGYWKIVVDDNTREILLEKFIDKPIFF